MSGSTLYAAGPRLAVVDLSDPSAPTVLGTTDLPFGARVAAAGGGLLLLAEWEERAVVDVNDPASPAVAGVVEADDSVLGAELHGGLAYVGIQWAGVHVLDLSDPASPSFLGPLAPVPQTAPTGVAFAGQHLLVTDHVGAGSAVLRSFAVGPDGLEPAGSAELPGEHAFDGVVDGDVAIVGIRRFVPDLTVVDLAVIDVADPAAPQVVGRSRAPVGATGQRSTSPGRWRWSPEVSSPTSPTRRRPW